VTIPTTPGQPTFIFLPEGERLAIPLPVDATQWESKLVELGQGPQRREAVMLSPLAAGLVVQTGLLFRSGLTLFLRLESRAIGGWLAAECHIVRAPDATPLQPELPTPPAIHLGFLYEGYTLALTGKQKTQPPWMPTRVFSDDTNTFIIFPRQLAFTRSPVAYGMQTDRTRVLVEQQPYIHPDETRGELLMIKGLWPVIELQDGTGSVLQIRRN
jgi:hypothetical protein